MVLLHPSVPSMSFSVLMVWMLLTKQLSSSLIAGCVAWSVWVPSVLSMLLTKQLSSFPVHIAGCVVWSVWVSPILHGQCQLIICTYLFYLCRGRQFPGLLEHIRWVVSRYHIEMMYDINNIYELRIKNRSESDLHSCKESPEKKSEASMGSYWSLNFFFSAFLLQLSLSCFTTAKITFTGKNHLLLLFFFFFQTPSNFCLS